jgi:hypothetical protein
MVMAGRGQFAVFNSATRISDVVGIGALVALLSCSGAFAGPAPAKPGDGAAVKRGFWEWDPSERRDPFDYKTVEAKADGPDIPGQTPGITDLIKKPTSDGPKQPTPPTRSEVTAQQVRNFADGKIDEAKYFLGLQQYARASESVQEALNKLKGIRIADPLLTERLDRVLVTAERLKTRAEIEREFKAISIDIQGIIWEPTNPVALIKGKSVREGDTVEGALVEQIRTSEIIFNFKGVRCRRKPGR